MKMYFTFICGHLMMLNEHVYMEDKVSETGSTRITFWRRQDIDMRNVNK